MTIRVAICDDQALVRDGLGVQLGYADDIDVDPERAKELIEKQVAI